MKTLRKSFIKKKLLGKASAKSQSAMEYLMTYGWAILIVAVVLGALYSLGVFNGAVFLGTSCIAASGFYCTNPTLSTSGVLTVTIGQATGTTLNNAYLYFVPSGTNFSTSDPSTSIGTLNSGQQVTVSIPLGVGSPYPAAYTLGTPLSGYLYLQFTDIYGTTEANKIATVLTKVTASSSGATFSQPTSIPSGIVAYVPITLSNSQSSATPSPFQQMIQINEGNYANYIAYNGNIANFEFFTQSGQILPAWIESNNSGTLTVWVNLPNGIPASSSLNIYLGFASKTTNLLSSSGTSGIGEAPQLSSTYAQYDDGASVFTYYYNVNPASITGWNITQTSVGLSTSAPSGNHYNAPNAYYSSSCQAGVFETSIPGLGENEIISYETYTTGVNGANFYFLVNSSQDGPMAELGTAGYGSGLLSSAGPCSYSNPRGPIESENTWYKNDIVIAGSTAYYYIGPSTNLLGQLGTQINSVSITPKGKYIGFDGAYDYGSDSGNTYYNDIIIRAYPPNGVMPSVSFSGLSTP
jgi:hypothetical protein